MRENVKSSLNSPSRFTHHVPKKILVLRGGAIGDFILTLPILSALRKHFPNAHLEILGYPHVANLALLNHLANAVRSLESPELAGFFADSVQLHPKWTSYFSEFDLIISYLSDPAKTLQKNIKRCSTAEFIGAPHRPNETENLHATEVFLQPLRQLGIHDADSTPRLNPKVGKRKSERVSVVASPTFFLSRFPTFANEAGSCCNSQMLLALHPGSGSEKKNWPEEKWGGLIDWLLKNVKSSLLLIGGEAEVEKLPRLAKRIPPQRLQLARNLPLPELAERLAVGQFFLGHDSGITHLAAAVGLPGLILWGDSKLEIWHPRSDKMTMLHSAEGLAQLSVATVMKELTQLLLPRTTFTQNG